MRFFYTPFSALLVGVLLYRLERFSAQDHGFVGDKVGRGRADGKTKIEDAHVGSYGTYGKYSGSVPTETVTSKPIRKHKQLTTQPTSLQHASTATDFDASESTFAGGYTISEGDVPPYVPKYSPKVEVPFIPPYIPQQKGERNVPPYVPPYVPPSVNPSSTFSPSPSPTPLPTLLPNHCCQCYSPPPPPKCMPICQGQYGGPSPYQVPNYGPMFPHYVPGSCQQPNQGHQGYDMHN